MSCCKKAKIKLHLKRRSFLFSTHIRHINEIFAKENKPIKYLLNYLRFWGGNYKVRICRFLRGKFKFIIENKLLSALFFPVLFLLVCSDSHHWAIHDNIIFFKYLREVIGDNSIIFNLSIGYIVSFIFYYLVVYRVEQKNTKKMKPMLHNLLAEATFILGDIIEVISCEFMVQNNNPKYTSIREFNDNELIIVLNNIKQNTPISLKTNASHNRHIINQQPNLCDYIRLSFEMLNHKIRSSSAIINTTDDTLLELLNHIGSMESTFNVFAYNDYDVSLRDNISLLRDIIKLDQKLTKHYCEYYS